MNRRIVRGQLAQLKVPVSEIQHLSVATQVVSHHLVYTIWPETLLNCSRLHKKIIIDTPHPRSVGTGQRILGQWTRNILKRLSRDLVIILRDREIENILPNTRTSRGYEQRTWLSMCSKFGARLQYQSSKMNANIRQVFNSSIATTFACMTRALFRNINKRDLSFDRVTVPPILQVPNPTRGSFKPAVSIKLGYALGAILSYGEYDNIYSYTDCSFGFPLFVFYDR